MDAGGINDDVLSNIGLGNDYKLSESGESNGYEQNGYGKELGRLQNPSEAERHNGMGEVGHLQSQAQNTPHTKRVHRSGVSAETLTSSGLTAEQISLKVQKKVDKIPFIKEAVNNGAYSNGQTFNNWIGGVRSGRGRDNSYSEWIKNARTALYDGRLPNGTRRSNDVGYSPGDGKYSSENYVKYSFDSAETDTAELTPERQKEIFEQYERDRAELPKQSKISQWGERAAWVAHNMTRVFPNIPERGERGTFFAEFRKSMIQWKNLSATAYVF